MFKYSDWELLYQYAISFKNLLFDPSAAYSIYLVKVPGLTEYRLAF